MVVFVVAMVNLLTAQSQSPHPTTTWLLSPQSNTTLLSAILRARRPRIGEGLENVAYTWQQTNCFRSGDPADDTVT